MSETSTRIAVRVDRGAFVLDVDVEWEERVVVLFGPSGAGKSTLLECLLGFHRDGRSTVRLHGATLADPASGTFVPTRDRRLGWVPQDSTLFPHCTVRENVDFGRRVAQGGDPRAAVRAVEVLEIGPLMERSVQSLSGGERQRVALARAIACGPRALLLDEPLASLDVPLRTRVLPYLMRVRDELAIPMVYITHDPDEAMIIGEVVVVIDGGRVVAKGAPRDVLWSRAVLPLSQSLGVENVFTGRVIGAGPPVSFETAAGLRLALPFDALDGDPIRIGLRAEDIVLAASPPGAISARNVIPAHVVCCEQRDGDVWVRMRVTESPASEELVAKVTPAAVDHLSLAAGGRVYAIVKAHALRRLG